MTEPPTVSRALFEALQILLTQREDECAALRDMLEDARGQLDTIRTALGVPYEPHQNVDERMLEAAREAGKLLGEKP
jgi:hypothetical protein